MEDLIKNQSIASSRIERILFPLKHSLLLSIVDPLQWFYIQPLVQELNRSVVVLSFFSLRNIGIQMPRGIHPLEFNDIVSCLDIDFTVDENKLVFSDIVFTCLKVLEPTGLIMCGYCSKELQIADLAYKQGIKVIYLAQGCSPEVNLLKSDIVLDWINMGCLLPVSSDDKRNIIGVCFRHNSREKRSRVQLNVVNELCKAFPAAQIGVVQSDDTLVATVDDIQLRTLHRVRILSASSWKELLSRGRVVISDDKDLLSQASLLGCRPLLYDWDTETYALWKCPLNGLYVSTWYKDAVRKIVNQLNIDVPYCPEEQVAEKLHIGCGNNFLTGWLNTDICDGGGIKFLDAGKTFPFINDTFEYVFSEHMFEHLSIEEGLLMLQECFRILKPGGHLRLTTPNLDFLIHLYEHPEEELHKEYIRWSICTFDETVASYYDKEDIPAMFVLNNFIRGWGHKMVYNEQVLKKMLERVGFKDVQTCRSGESRWLALKGIEHHDMQIPSPYNVLESMTLEATK
jgi:predicted SAM-dependent methyltransferase